MEEGKPSLKRAESQTSTRSRTPSVKWKDPVLSPTFHDVHIEQVQIIGPPPNQPRTNVEPGPVERHSAGGSSGGLRVIAPPPSEEGSMATDNSEERRVFRENYLYEANRRVPSVPLRTTETKQERGDGVLRFMKPDPGRSSTVPLINLPLEPPGTVISRDRASRTRQQSRQRSSVIEQRHRQRLAILRHMQRLQSDESPQQRRLMSSPGKKRHRERCYEVAPGVIVTELPPEEQPQTAPEGDFRIVDDPIYELYERRAKTVPRMTKSIIWTDKNRVASGRAVSSTSSKWRSDEFSDMDQQRKPNIFIKMPFKQTPAITMNPEKMEEMVDDIVRPGYELRLTTAFTVSRVKKILNRLEPPIKNNDVRPGRLLKGKLKSLYPVKIRGPAINHCQGIQPEAQTVKPGQSYTPSPSRQRSLKDRLNRAYEEHRLRREEYEKKMIRAQSTASQESVHRTSPEPGNYSVLPDDGIVLNQRTGLDGSLYAEQTSIAVTNRLESMHLESGVIY